MAKAVFDELRAARPKNGFTVGIIDDVTHTSLAVDPAFTIEPDDVVRAVFYGLGADGTVGANKNSVKIIAEDAGLYAQGYFVYDSHKSGAQTVSHLRFGPRPIHAPYLIQRANFVGLPPVPVRGADRRAAPRGAGRHVPAEQPVRPGRGLGSPAALDAAADHRQALRFFVIDASKVADAGRAARPHQHRAADLLLRDLRRAAAGRGDPAHQARDREDLRREGRGGRAPELPGGRRHAGAAVRGHRPRRGDEPVRAAADRAGRRARVRAHGHREDDGGPRRRDPRQRDAGRRHVPVRHRGVGEAQHRRRGAGLGAGALRPVRPVQLRLPARGDPRQVLRRGRRSRAAPADFKSAPINVRGFPDVRFTLQFYVEDCTGCGLCVEACPAHSPVDPEREGDQPPRQAAAGRAGASGDRVLRDPAGERPRTGRFRQRARRAVPRAAVRVLRRLRRLRRDAVPEAAVAAVRRPDAGRQRDRLLVDLRRQPAGDAVVHEPGGPRPGLVQLAVRGQRRVRSRLPAGRRQAPGARRRSRADAGAAARRGARRRDPHRAAGRRSPRFARSARGWRS